MVLPGNSTDRRFWRRGGGDIRRGNTDCFRLNLADLKISFRIWLGYDESWWWAVSSGSRWGTAGFVLRRHGNEGVRLFPRGTTDRHSISGDVVDDSASEFVILWTRYQPEVRRYIGMFVRKSADADDILQQTASRLWEKFEEYDSERPFVPWAIGFAYYEVLSWRQKQGRDRLVFSEQILAQLHTTIRQESSLLEIRRRALDGCLQKLSVKERQLILQRYAEHGAIQKEANRSRVSRHKLYYAIEKLRMRLLACIDDTMQQEGWQHG